MKLGMILGAMMAMLTMTACGKTPCDNLQDLCTACSNNSQRQGCQNLVNTAKTLAAIPGGAGAANDSCQAAINSEAYKTDGAACKAAN
jgi:hypothetical protein